MIYNPYDLVPLLVNGQPIQGRPIEFDSDVVNQKTMTNAFGELVKPTKVMTLCPNCSQGLEVQVKFDDPPFAPFVHSCPYCRPAPPPLVDPFVNPVKSGRVPAHELDPLLLDPSKPLPQDETPVAARFHIPETVTVEVPVEAPKTPAPAPRPKAAKKAKPKPAKTAKKDKPQMVRQPDPEVAPPRQTEPDPFSLTTVTDNRSVKLEGAEGLSAEQDFDDNDLLEHS